MKNLVIVTVEVKQVAAIAVIGEASSSKRQWSRCSRLRRRVAVAAMAWLCAVASVTVGSCFARLHLQSVGCCFTRLLFGVSPSPISELYVWCELWCECMFVCLQIFFYLRSKICFTLFCLPLCFINFILLISKLTRSVFRIIRSELDIFPIGSD
ncbi:hypothetical protein WN944_018973 [Citrus x changshan-huyou]|uniref:Transmembrane protein n=1 Tax=Citrus x changshan-huyou TaxID=2935761 RepID=A0AAP0LUL2_9ROSI